VFAVVLFVSDLIEPYRCTPTYGKINGNSYVSSSVDSDITNNELQARDYSVTSADRTNTQASVYKPTVERSDPCNSRSACLRSLSITILRYSTLDRSLTFLQLLDHSQVSMNVVTFVTVTFLSSSRCSFQHLTR
jgi:hypothetical protein